MNRSGWLIGILGLGVFLSALGAVYAAHLNRSRFANLESLRQERNHLSIRWGQLELEQGTLAANARVAHLARTKLGMGSPDKVVLVEVK